MMKTIDTESEARKHYIDETGRVPEKVFYFDGMYIFEDDGGRSKSKDTVSYYCMNVKTGTIDKYNPFGEGLKKADEFMEAAKKGVDTRTKSSQTG